MLRWVKFLEKKLRNKILSFKKKEKQDMVIFFFKDILILIKFIFF
jgi:hypothetical protein